jgi:antitoxin (DNA-binding transcriptional repressor) of toxin-antitoxin stability system
MAVTNMRGLRDTRRIKAWLRAGESIEIRDRNEVIGRILPEKKKPRKKDWPDFAARRKEIFGDRILPAVDDFLEDRHRW